MNDKKQADKIIKELQDAGLNYDQMLEVIKLARAKFEAMKETDFYKKLEANGWKDTDHCGHLIYKKNNIEYAVCCETIYINNNPQEMKKEEFEKKYLTRNE